MQNCGCIYCRLIMSTRETSHTRNRIKVCIGCMRKGKRSLSEEDIRLIKKHILPPFNEADQSFPRALCNSCYILLRKAERDEKVNFRDINREERLPLNLRDKSSYPCTCKIYNVSTSNGRLAVKLKRKAGRPIIMLHFKASKTHFNVQNRPF